MSGADVNDRQGAASEQTLYIVSANLVLNYHPQKYLSRSLRNFGSPVRYGASALTESLVPPSLVHGSEAMPVTYSHATNLHYCSTLQTLQASWAGQLQCSPCAWHSSCCSTCREAATHSCSPAFQMSELTARTEAEPWDVQAWEGLYRETTAAAAKLPPSEAAAQEINILEQLLKQFPSAVQLPRPSVCMRRPASRMRSHITSQAPHDQACSGHE